MIRAHLGAPVDPFPEFLAGLENRDPLGLDADLGSRLGVSPFTGAALLDLETSEPPDLHPWIVASGQSTLDALQNLVDDDLGLFLRQPLDPLGNLFDKFLFRHRPLPESCLTLFSVLLLYG